ncbi:hypothetical protein FVF58_11355 [Paraburkholderia panacisoli]|uniref:Uncharacterized protein n=1 Tax=Paraburkholderia panacisoli TaxID=2603818 RepID=A0A5B0HB00_9BURK|nr:hypothetical protein FVF58_11355 [Paraburkholderia panacisoli]
MAGRAADTADAHAEACAPRCASCRYRAEDRHSLEQSVPGLTAFSSGFGASVADSRLCRLHDQLVSPGDVCARFEVVLAR